MHYMLLNLNVCVCHFIDVFCCRGCSADANSLVGWIELSFMLIRCGDLMQLTHTQQFRFGKVEQRSHGSVLVQISYDDAL